MSKSDMGVVLTHAHDRANTMLAPDQDAHVEATFPVKEYVVTPGFACCLVLCPEHLTLETEEAVYKRETPCSTETKRMPYGELGSVDAVTSCGCCAGVSTNLTPDGAIQPGCGCQKELVAEVSEELKVRMKARGDTGNIKRAEQTIDMVQKVTDDVSVLAAKVDLILAHLKIPQPAEMERAV